MTRIRRTSLEVTLDELSNLERLEKLKAKYEKELEKNAGKPIHWALIKAVAEVTAMIVSIVRAIKRRSKKRRK